MRKDIEFKIEDGVTLRGWHYLPDSRQGKLPTIIMAHGFSAVKEMYLDRFAEVFAAAGLSSVVFDNRNFGASEGEPRQEIDPWRQLRDYRDAITYAETLASTDPNRIGIWGSSYSGGHVLVVGAIDRRVRCVVSQVPLASGHNNARRLVRADYLAGVQGMFEQDRRARMAGKPAAMIPVSGRRSSSSLNIADASQLEVVHGDWMRAILEERGDAPLGDFNGKVVLQLTERHSRRASGIVIAPPHRIAEGRSRQQMYGPHHRSGQSLDVTAKVRLRRRSIDDFYPLALATRHEGATLKLRRVVNVNGFGQPSYRPVLIEASFLQPRRFVEDRM